MTPTIDQVTATSRFNGSSLSWVGDLPTGITVGELLVAVIQTRSINTITFDALPSGWSEAFQNFTVRGWVGVFSKEADGTETGTVAWTLPTGGGTGNGIEIFRVAGADTTTPFPDGLQVDASDPGTDTNLAIPAITTSLNDSLVVAGGLIRNINSSLSGWSGSLTELWDGIGGTTAANWFNGGGAFVDAPTAGVQGPWTATASAVGPDTGFSFAIAPAPTAATETLVPVAGGAVTNLSAYDATKINEPVGSDDTEWLTGTDPSAQTGLTNGPEYVDGPASSTAWSGGTAATWGTYANVIDTSESTNSTVTLTSTNTDYQNWFTFAAGDWTDLPANAVITGFSVTVRSTIGTANRVQHHIALGTANGTLVAGSSEINLADNAVSTTTLGASTDTEKTVSAFGAFPTRAELVTGTFGVRFRQRRSNTSTITIYSIKATATYTIPGLTTNTEVRAPMSDPTGTLATGAATGTIRARVRKLGSGTDPTAVITVRNVAGTSLATAVASTAVTNTSGQILSGTFDQSVISDKTDVVVWVTATGASGGLVEVGAIEWIAQVAAAPPLTTDVAGRGSGERSGDQSSAIQANLSTSVTGRASGERGGDHTSVISAGALQSTSVTGRASGERGGDATSAIQANLSTSAIGRDTGERGGTPTSAAQANLATSVTGRATGERGGDATTSAQANLATSVTGRGSGERSGTHTSAVGTTPQSTSVTGRATGERGGSQSSSVQASLKTHLKRELVLGDDEYLGDTFVLGGGIGFVEPAPVSGTHTSAVTVGAVAAPAGKGSDERAGAVSSSVQASQSTSVIGRATSERSGAQSSALQANLATSITGKASDESGGTHTTILGATPQSTSVTGRASGERSGAQSSTIQASLSTSVTGRATGERGGTHTSTLATPPQSTSVTGRATDERSGIPSSALQAGMSTSVLGKNDSGAPGAAPTTVFSIPQVVRPTVVVTLETVPTATVTLETVPKATVTLETVPTVSVSMETVPRVVTDLETVPMALVTVE